MVAMASLSSTRLASRKKSSAYKETQSVASFMVRESITTTPVCRSAFVSTTQNHLTFGLKGSTSSITRSSSGLQPLMDKWKILLSGKLSVQLPHAWFNSLQNLHSSPEESLNPRLLSSQSNVRQPVLETEEVKHCQ